MLVDPRTMSDPALPAELWLAILPQLAWADLQRVRRLNRSFARLLATERAFDKLLFRSQPPKSKLVGGKWKAATIHPALMALWSVGTTASGALTVRLGGPGARASLLSTASWRDERATCTAPAQVVFAIGTATASAVDLDDGVSVERAIQALHEVLVGAGCRASALGDEVVVCNLLQHASPILHGRGLIKAYRSRSRSAAALFEEVEPAQTPTLTFILSLDNLCPSLPAPGPPLLSLAALTHLVPLAPARPCRTLTSTLARPSVVSRARRPAARPTRPPPLVQTHMHLPPSPLPPDRSHYPPPPSTSRAARQRKGTHISGRLPPDAHPLRPTRTHICTSDAQCARARRAESVYELCATRSLTPATSTAAVFSGFSTSSAPADLPSTTAVDGEGEGSRTMYGKPQGERVKTNVLAGSLMLSMRTARRRGKGRGVSPSAGRRG